MQRRLVALAIVFCVTILAFVAAYSIPSQTPAHVPDTRAGVEFSAAAKQAPGQVVVAYLDGAELLLPVKQESTTAIAFHPVDNPNGVALTPGGDRAANDEARGLANPSAAGDVSYYLMDGSANAASPSTAGLDVGAVPGVLVYSPIEGKVTAVKTYKLLGSHADCEIDIQFTADPTLLLVVTHIVSPQAHVGDTVAAGVSILGRLRAFPPEVQQGIRQFTNDAGDHVEMVALRVSPNLAGF